MGRWSTTHRMIHRDDQLVSDKISRVLVRTRDGKPLMPFLGKERQGQTPIQAPRYSFNASAMLDPTVYINKLFVY